MSAAVALLFSEALDLHQRGRISEAEERYRHILADAPDHADALHLLGLSAHQRGDGERALPAIFRAVRLQPATPVYLENLGAVLSTSHRYREAAGAHRTALLLTPGDSACYRRYAASLKKTGYPDLALWALAAAAKLSPLTPEPHEAIGNLFNSHGHAREAAGYYARALCIEPSSYDGWNNLGVAVRTLGNASHAIAAYGRAILLKPDSAETYSNRGYALQQTGALDDAIADQLVAIRLNPGLAVAHNNLGNAYFSRGMADRAMSACRMAIMLQPAYHEAWNNLGNALKGLKKLANASKAYRTAIVIKSDGAEAWNNLGNLLKDQAQFSEASHAYRTALQFNPGLVEAHSNLICALQYGHGGPQEIVAEARRFGERWAESGGSPTEPGSGHPLRIGYVSGDFVRHPVGFFVEAALAHHDPSAVEIFCYDNSLLQDTQTARLRSLAAHWHRVAGLPDHDAAQLIHSHRIDILVDLSGHTAGNRLPLFARRPAPVQASWLGYWSTTGLRQMDWLISDSITLPAGEEKDYPETVIRLPGCRFCYTPPSYAPAPRLNDADRPVTFGSFNNLAKVGPGSLALWARILDAAPHARLLLKWKSLADEQTRRRILADFGALGIDEARLDLRSESDHAAMLAEYGDVDVALDPIRFSGGATSCEALWMGVPVLTLSGDVPQSHQTAGFLHAIGQPEWIARTQDDYVARAAELAGRGKRDTDARQSLRERMTASPLCDAAGFTRGLEAAFRRMWRA